MQTFELANKTKNKQTNKGHNTTPNCYRILHSSSVHSSCSSQKIWKSISQKHKELSEIRLCQNFFFLKKKSFLNIFLDFLTTFHKIFWISQHVFWISQHFLDFSVIFRCASISKLYPCERVSQSVGGS